jgi:hypothetical protein
VGLKVARDALISAPSRSLVISAETTADSLSSRLGNTAARAPQHQIPFAPDEGIEDENMNQSLHRAFELATRKSGASLIVFTDLTGIEEAVVDYKGARIQLACYNTHTIVWACRIDETPIIDVDKTPGAALRAAIRLLDAHAEKNVAVAA